MKLLNTYQNGNATVEIFSDGTRTIEWKDGEELDLDFPLNIDIRLMTKCDFGYNPTTGKSVCSFCHESARTDGEECDYQALLEVLTEANLPAGIELAIGMNDITTGLISFLQSCKSYGWIVNGTINQGALAKRGSQTKLRTLIDNDLLKGVGSFTYQFNTRDSLGFAMKSTWAVIEGKETLLYKDPKTDDGTKRSQRGRVAVLNDGNTFVDGLYLDNPELKESELVTVFNDGELLKEYSWEEIKSNVQKSVDLELQ